MGVRLTPAGEKLAGLVLRRHRLIELFLVKVLGMSWAEVHDEAERLEHAVSERLIDRIDEMLGRPAVDPHGDPIPTPRARSRGRITLDLLTAPTRRRRSRVTRVIDQDASSCASSSSTISFPGRTITVEARDDASGAVHWCQKMAAHATIGMRAAAKIQVACSVRAAWSRGLTRPADSL